MPNDNVTKIGFTGTRKGMTREQLDGVALQILGATELHHGDCVGADAEMHSLCSSHVDRVELYPAAGSQRAFCRGASKIHSTKPPLVRNHSIVDAVDRLVAAPSGDEIRRSGTWATIRYAIKMNVPVRIVMPDGDVTHR